jgi:glucose-6-phosphate 1-epimerase
MIVESSWQGLPTLLIDTPQARCEISLQGAQVLSFIPKPEGRDLLWCSPARLQPGRPVRGGIPVCWPWFSRQGRPATSVQHGFARGMRWSLESCTEERGVGREDHRESGLEIGSEDTCESGSERGTGDKDGKRVIACFALRAPAAGWPEPDWPAGCEVWVRVEIGRALTVRLVTRNAGPQAVRLTQALHTYLRVGDVRRTRLSGLQGLDYLDNLQGLRRLHQDGEWRFGTRLEPDGPSVPACDRIYLHTRPEQVLHDPILGRQIRIGSAGSASTVVWNAGPEGILALDDVPADAWPGYLCVEAANCLPVDAVHLPPGAHTELSQTLSAAPEHRSPPEPGSGPGHSPETR